MIACRHIPMLMLLSSMPLQADAPAVTPEYSVDAPSEEFKPSSMPAVVLEFESCIRQIRDERSAIAQTSQVQALVPRMKELLLSRRWENPEEALVLAQILNSAFNLLLTEPPCYGSPELASALGELLSLFSGK